MPVKTIIFTRALNKNNYGTPKKVFSREYCEVLRTDFV